MQQKWKAMILRMIRVKPLLENDSFQFLKKSVFELRSLIFKQNSLIVNIAPKACDGDTKMNAGYISLIFKNKNQSN
jgi:hypothetical protein